MYLEYYRILECLWQGKNPFPFSDRENNVDVEESNILDDPKCIRALAAAKNAIRLKYLDKKGMPFEESNYKNTNFRSVDATLEMFRSKELNSIVSVVVFDTICAHPEGIARYDLINKHQLSEQKLNAILGSINYKWRLFIKNPKSRAYEKKGSRYYRLSSNKFKLDLDKDYGDY